MHIMHIRNHNWLENRFEYLLRTYFSDIEVPNKLTIRFSKKSKRQLGCIAKRYPKTILGRIKGHFESEIRINGYFRDLSIPEEVIDGTIIHELCHYVHGFSSPLPQKLRYPHQGGAIKHEMIKRGAGDIYLFEKKWLKVNWQEYLKRNH